MKSAALIGINYNEFLDITPKVLNIYVNAYVRRKEEESKEKITLSYLNAMWTAQWFGKNKPKPLKEILKNNCDKEAMTDEQMLNQIKVLNAMFGGEVMSNGN